MLNEEIKYNNMQTELSTIVLKEELINDNSLLQIVKTKEEKLLLRCRFISSENGCMDESIICEFTEDNIEKYSVYYTDDYVIIFQKDKQEVTKLYELNLHYSIEDATTCSWIYDSSCRNNEATRIKKEKAKTNFTFTKIILPK